MGGRQTWGTTRLSRRGSCGVGLTRQYGDAHPCTLVVLPNLICGVDAQASADVRESASWEGKCGAAQEKVLDYDKCGYNYPILMMFHARQHFPDMVASDGTPNNSLLSRSKHTKDKTNNES